RRRERALLPRQHDDAVRRRQENVRRNSQGLRIAVRIRLLKNVRAITKLRLTVFADISAKAQAVRGKLGNNFCRQNLRLATRSSTLSPRRPGGEGSPRTAGPTGRSGGRGADKPVRGAAPLTLPGPAPPPP